LDEVFLVVSVIKENLSLWVIGLRRSLVNGDWSVSAAHQESEEAINVMYCRKTQDDDLVKGGINGISFDDCLACCFEFNVSVMDSRENKGVEGEHDQDVNNNPPDENVSSDSSVVLLKDFLSFRVINNDIESL
jgi:hypothetical protein